MTATPSDWKSFVRGLAIGRLMAEGRAVTSEFIAERFGVSIATAKRDMIAIEWALKADRSQENGHTTAKATLRLSATLGGRDVAPRADGGS